jgi:hypothetical protein
MVHYSVLVPARDATAAVRRLITELGEVLRPLLLPYEIICIDDGSALPLDGALGDADEPQLRVLRFDQPRGASAALSAGVAAARGDLILGISPGHALATSLVPHLISRLARFDLVVAQPERWLGQSLVRGLLAAPRLLRDDAGRRGSGVIYFAARREAVAGLALARGAFRVLPELVARRGFRVGQVIVAEGLPPRGERLRFRVVRRLAARWLGRSFEPHRARELPLGEGAPGPSHVPHRGGLVGHGPARPTPTAPLEPHHGTP